LARILRSTRATGGAAWDPAHVHNPKGPRLVVEQLQHAEALLDNFKKIDPTTITHTYTLNANSLGPLSTTDPT
jgi:hypothetical protein